MDVNNLSKYVSKDHVDEVKELLQNDGQILKRVSLKNPTVSMILAIFVGIIGIDRLYQGGISLFLAKLGMILLTLGTWWIVDMGYTMMMTKEDNYRRIVAAAA